MTRNFLIAVTWCYAPDREAGNTPDVQKSRGQERGKPGSSVIRSTEMLRT